VLKNCISGMRRGGWVRVLGVYGIPYDAFPLGQIFDKGIKMAFGQAPVQKYIDELIRLLEEGMIQLDDIISHRLPLAEASRGYEIFNDKKDGCVKVALKPQSSR
jgi:S-(hydroxymethyl)glutathione dehydrogenase/alcohol dehydrogenase